MISKNQLKGKYVTYVDSQGKIRTNKVVRIAGKTLTVQDACKRRRRIHPDRNDIMGRQFRKKGMEEIRWK